MTRLIDRAATSTSDFFQVSGEGVEAWARDREKGASLFLRLGEGSRIELIASILDTWMDDGDLNRAMVSGALRHAWDSEPHLGGIRMGSFVTSAVPRLAEAEAFSIEEFVEEWGASLMTEAEKRDLEAMKFPLTVYRGGTGTFDEVASGVSWTLKREVAAFYANEWPRRWGSTKQSVVLSATVDENEAHAFLNDRSEEELLVPYPDLDAIASL